MAIARCEYMTCDSMLGAEYRLIVNGKLVRSNACREHEDLLDMAFKERAPVRLTAEGHIYIDVFDELIRRGWK